MSDAVRERIFGRLKSALKREGLPVPPETPVPSVTLTLDEKIARFSQLMEAVRTEVHAVPTDRWMETLRQILREKRVKTLAYGPKSELGQSLQEAWAKQGDPLPELVGYESEVEDFKDALFEIDAGITSTLGGIADVGAVIMWPDGDEPRLLSLVPPIHIAVVKASTLYTDFSEVITREGWSGGMPTNALLISGPSKTADIEFQLVFGVHGPKELVVLLVTDA